MSGILGHLTDAIAVQAEVGCDFDTALAIVKAANEYEAPADNVIAVDFAARRRIDNGQLES